MSKGKILRKRNRQVNVYMGRPIFSGVAKAFSKIPIWTIPITRAKTTGVSVSA
jgi:hypothetical protein